MFFFGEPHVMWSQGPLRGVGVSYSTGLRCGPGGISTGIGLEGWFEKAKGQQSKNGNECGSIPINTILIGKIAMNH